MLTLKMNKTDFLINRNPNKTVEIVKIFHRTNKTNQQGNVKDVSKPTVNSRLLLGRPHLRRKIECTVPLSNSTRTTLRKIIIREAELFALPSFNKTFKRLNKTKNDENNVQIQSLPSWPNKSLLRASKQTI